MSGRGTSYNLLGEGGNDAFLLSAGDDSTSMTATGFGSNAFILTTGKGNSAFSLTSGDSSAFVIVESNLDNGGGFQTFTITGGSLCSLDETSMGLLGNAIWTVNLGTRSTVNLGSTFSGDQSIINVVF